MTNIPGTQSQKFTTLVNRKGVPVLLLVGAILGSIIGAVLLGHVLETIARFVFQLPHAELTSLILPFAGLTIAGVLGTLILVAGILVDNKAMKVSIIVASVAFPILIEIVDLTIRAFSVWNALLVEYPFLAT